MYIDNPELHAMINHLMETRDPSALLPIAGLIEDETGDGNEPDPETFVGFLKLVNLACAKWKATPDEISVLISPIAARGMLYVSDTDVLARRVRSPGSCEQIFVFYGLICNGVTVCIQWIFKFQSPTQHENINLAAPITAPLPLGEIWWTEYKTEDAVGFLDRCIETDPGDSVIRLQGKRKK